MERSAAGGGTSWAVSMARLLRLVARGWRRLKRQLRAQPAFRELSDEIFHGEYTPAEQYDQEILVADTVRMDAYRAAIRRNIKAGDVVVDLGTGTGILAMLAAQQSPKIVHAIDYSNIIALAERVAHANHFSNIAFHRTTSRRFVLDEPVDVILHELIGEALFCEGLVEKTLDLKRRLLKKSGRILPGKFELFLEPARVKDDYRVPYLWETRFPGIDFSAVRDSTWNTTSQSGHDWQVNTRSSIDCFLCDSTPVLTFDLNELHEPAEIPTTVSVSRVVRRPGRMDGFCLYFRVVFDAEVAFDTSPFSPRTDWDNLHFRIEARDCHLGETIAYRLEMKDVLDFRSWTIEVISAGRVEGLFGP